MGQQQLMLLVIGLLVVGIATMAGLFAFARNMEQAEADDIVNRNLEIANSAVVWKTKKDPYDGGNASYSGLNTSGFAKLLMDATTHFGTFQIKSLSSNSLVITGVSDRYPELGAMTYVNGYSVDSTTVDFGGSIELE
jgi:hypothetical protein